MGIIKYKGCYIWIMTHICECKGKSGNYLSEQVKAWLKHQEPTFPLHENKDKKNIHTKNYQF